MEKRSGRIKRKKYENAIGKTYTVRLSESDANYIRDYAHARRRTIKEVLEYIIKETVKQWKS